MMIGSSQVLSTEEMFLQAVAFHEQGQLYQAEQLYRAILIGDQDHLGALHNLEYCAFSAVITRMPWHLRLMSCVSSRTCRPLTIRWQLPSNI
jgi:hypothetical protein